MKYIVDIKGDIEGDYDIVGKYEERCGVRENKHGEWISVCNGKQCNCSNCGTGYDHTYEFIEEWNYCPNCGCRMKEGDAE